MRSARWGAKEAVLPGRAEGCRPIPNTHRSDASSERGAKCSVIVANEILRCRVPGERFSDLARQPLGRRVAGHRKPQQLPTFVAENKKCKELLKRNRRNHEQINRRNPLHMIAKERLPSLQWPIPPRYHVDGNRGLGDRDAEFEQFAVNLGRAPQRVLKTHSSDQLAHLSGDPRSATRRAGFPSPVAGKTLAMPAHDSLGPDDAQGIKNARVATIEPDEQGAVDPTQMQSTARRALPQDVSIKISASSRARGLKRSHSIRTNKRPTANIRRSCSDSSVTASQMDGVFRSDSGAHRF